MEGDHESYQQAVRLQNMQRRARDGAVSRRQYAVSFRCVLTFRFHAYDKRAMPEIDERNTPNHPPIHDQYHDAPWPTPSQAHDLLLLLLPLLLVRLPGHTHAQNTFNRRSTHTQTRTHKRACVRMHVRMHTHAPPPPLTRTIHRSPPRFLGRTPPRPLLATLALSLTPRHFTTTTTNTTSPRRRLAQSLQHVTSVACHGACLSVSTLQLQHVSTRA